MEIKLKRAYSSHWDNIEYPIFKLADDSYLCISYSCNHHVYGMNTYTKEEFIESGFQEDDTCDDIFESLTRKEIFGVD